MKFTNKPILTLLVGMSYSGKSTFLAQHTAEYPPETIVSPDNIRREVLGDVNNQDKGWLIWNIATKQIHKKLEQHGACVLDALNITSSSRSSLLKQFPDAHKVAIVFPADLSVSKQRQIADKDKDRSQVPDDVLERQFRNYNNGLQNLETQFDEVHYIKSRA